jgi:hypothetical protein
MRPGPSDDRIYVIEPIGKRRPYGLRAGPYGTPYLYLPPWRGPIQPPAVPAPDGHFDQIPEDTPEFAQAHLFGTVRFVLDLWEHYFGQSIEWHFARDFDRLEVVQLTSLDNAWAGYGFMEVGAQHNDDATVTPFALNFDVVAHELGHLIMYETIGVPAATADRGEYFGFHESAADVVALIAASNFDSLIESLLEDTRGNLYSFNELDRFAELSATRQIRLASNSVRLSHFASGWRDEHALSQPLTGALFDIFVDIFQENLVERGLIARIVADLTETIRTYPERGPIIQAAFDAAYPGREEGFREAFAEARDYSGNALAEAWKRTSPDSLDYAEFGDLLLAVDREQSGGRYQEEIFESFVWREIGRVAIGPRLVGSGRDSHASSARTIVPEMGRHLPKMPYRERALIARGL